MRSSTEMANEIIQKFVESKAFSVTVLEIDSLTQADWVMLKTDPNEFRKKMFDGDWAHENRHPELGSIRVLRIVTGHDGITRAIARQGEFLFAYPRQ